MSAEADAAHELVDQLCGQPGAAAMRWVQVLHAHAAALAWVRQTGAHPTPQHVSARLNQAPADLADPDAKSPLGCQ